MADQKLTELAEDTSPDSADLLYMVDDPGGVPASRKATMANVVLAGWPNIGATVYHSAAQAVANSSYTVLAFNSELRDTHSFHDTAVNNSRLTIPAGQSGIYIVGFRLAWNNNDVDGDRTVGLVLNGVSDLGAARQLAAASGYTQQAFAQVMSLVAGDYVTVSAWQNSGSSINILSGAYYSPYFWLQRIA